MALQVSFHFTVFTPTYNRANTLTRVYKSLVNQTYKDFIWLIVDDGSTDNTNLLVKKWMYENLLPIEYKYKENKGKHTALAMALDLTKSKYFIILDSDDELVPNALDVFNAQWYNIENEGLVNEIAEIRAQTIYESGRIVGSSKFSFPKGINYLDSTWHEMVLKQHNNNEMVTAWDCSKLKESITIPCQFWHSDKVSNLRDFVLWTQLSKKYKTRYISNRLRIMHLDGGERLSCIKDKIKGFYNDMVGNKYFLDNNMEFFFFNPKYYLSLILKFIIAGFVLNSKPLELFRAIESKKFRFIFLILLPFASLAYIYFKYIRKRFWI